jgi:PRTRC genetic system protein D
MNITVDIGYNTTKTIGPDRKPIIFPSITGTPDKSRFSLNGHSDGIILTSPFHKLVGEQVEEQSLFSQRWEDRDWIKTDDYLAMLYAAFTEVTGSVHANVNVVTGLPVRFYEEDRDPLKERLMGRHKISREGRQQPQTFDVVRVKVIPQNVGTYLSVALSDQGRQAVDNDFIMGKVGVIDVGSLTTNFLVMSKFTELRQESVSIEAGGWKLSRQVREHLARLCPDLELKDHQLMQAIKDRSVSYYGERVNLAAIVDEACDNLTHQIVGKAKERWGKGAFLHSILVTGGGSLLLGDRITREFRHAHQVDDPVFANVQGYWKLAQREEVWK